MSDFNDVKHCFHKTINQIPYDFTVWWDSEFETFAGDVSLSGEVVLSTDRRIDNVANLEFDMRTIIPNYIKEKLYEFEKESIDIDHNRSYNKPASTKNKIELALEQLFT